MINKSVKFFIVIFCLLIILLISYLSFNSSFRRTVLTYIFATHDYYQLKSLTLDVSNRNFRDASKKINNYINISKKLSNERSFMLRGIYEAVDLVTSRAINQEDFNFMEDIYVSLVEMDPKLYKPKVWLARALSDTDYKESLLLLEEAISISPSQSDAYREIIRIGQKNNDLNSIKKYCKIYENSLIAGLLDGQNFRFGNLYDSNNSRKFSIRFSSNGIDDFYYHHSGIQLNELQKYEFIPLKPININGIDLFFNLAPGTKIIIKELILFSKGKKITIQNDELSISSNGAFVMNDVNLTLFIAEYLDEKIRLRFSNNNYFESVEKVEILMNFKKMKLTNNTICP